MTTVSDILDGIKHGLPNSVNIARVNRAVSLISKRLFYHKSSLAQGALAVSVSADASSASLPADYWGMVDLPHINGNTYPLKIVPNIQTKLKYTETGTPVYFEVKGQSIYLYPGTSSSITINGDYWSKPTALTALMDTVPFSGVFDEAIREALLSTPPDGSGRSLSEGTIMQKIINQFVDDIAPHRDIKAPTRVIDNMNLDFLSEEDWL